MGRAPGEYSRLQVTGMIKGIFWFVIFDSRIFFLGGGGGVEKLGNYFLGGLF